MKSVPFFKQSALLKPAVWGLYDVLPLKNLSRLRLLPFVKGALANPKIPHDIFGLAATLVLLYGLDDLSLIESACFHYPKNQKIILLTLYDLWGEYNPVVSILGVIQTEYRESRRLPCYKKTRPRRFSNSRKSDVCQNSFTFKIGEIKK